MYERDIESRWRRFFFADLNLKERAESALFDRFVFSLLKTNLE